MTSTYGTILSRCLLFMGTTEFVNMSEQDAKEYLKDCLHSIVGEPYVRQIFSTIEFDDDNEELKFTYVNNSELDEDIAIEILAHGTAIKWLMSKIHDLSLVVQFFGTRDQKFSSQANQLKELRTLLDAEEISVRRMISDYGSYTNPYLNKEG